MRHAPFLTAVCLASLAGSATTQSIAGIQTDTDTSDEIVLDLYSGHGVPGGADSEVTVFPGPALTGFSGALQPRHFQAARNGLPAAILGVAPWPVQGLTTHPSAQWIAPDQASGTGASTAAGLFAIDFDVPAVAVLDARLDLTFSSDDYLGFGQNAGVFVNELPVPGTGQFFGHNDQFDHTGLNVTSLLRGGENTLYLYLVNSGGPGGLLFHARITINGVLPDDCVDAVPAHLDDNSGSTNTYTTSATTGSCGIQNDRWYYFVPPLSGTLAATLSKADGSAYDPALAVFRGSCGNLIELACNLASPSTWSATVKAGVPILLAVGGATADTGAYNLRLEITPQLGGLVYPGNGHLYQVSPGTLDITGARAYAQSLGGYLAAVNDQAENDWLQSQLAGGNAVWIGLSDEITEGTYLWDSGEPFLFSAWNAGEPNDSQSCNGEDYVEMIPSGLWNDLNTGLNPCGDHVRRALVEIPASGLAATADLGGACGPASITPTLYSEPHQIGQTVDLAVLGAGAGDAILVYKSAPPVAPAPVLDCLVHLDPGTTTLVAGLLADEYGSVSSGVAVPNDPLLIGVIEIWQAQVFPLSGALSYTNALELTLGN